MGSLLVRRGERNELWVPFYIVLVFCPRDAGCVAVLFGCLATFSCFFELPITRKLVYAPHKLNDICVTRTLYLTCDPFFWPHIQDKLPQIIQFRVSLLLHITSRQYSTSSFCPSRCASEIHFYYSFRFHFFLYIRLASNSFLKFHQTGILVLKEKNEFRIKELGCTL